MNKCLAVIAATTCMLVTQAQQVYKAVNVYATTKATNDRIKFKGSYPLTNFGQPLETQPCVFIDPQHKFQTFIGVGGAITDASAETFFKMPPAVQKELMHAYYDTVNGIGYRMLRTNINSCDFSSDSYVYVKDGDADLKSFNVAHDERYKIPMLQQAMAFNKGMRFFVSPWSPPAWMKTNNTMLQGGSLLPQYRQNWANYFVQFIKTYEAKGMPIWGLSVQNEPMAKQKWESCIYTAEEERDFVKNYLGPTLHANGMAAKKLIVWDHNRDLIHQRADVILNDPQASKYVWGVGFHWYETWTGSGMQFGNLRQVKESFPDKELIFTEGCVEKFDLKRINDWSLGERYGYSMIHDFNAGTVAWTDWNVLLDEKGGPNHVGNFCFAPIHANTKTGKLLYTNSYYYIGHFSKFIQPGAKRIASSTNRDILEATAFENIDGKIVVVVLNRSEQDLPYKLCIGGKAINVTSSKHSIATLIVE
ncbi:MAG TPA: glycoside hydrolase family 30 protein [Phnomibacter sp.]|nr:glycoside hydrolase family 30 protein [Phnomibacter sp.]